MLCEQARATASNILSQGHSEYFVALRLDASLVNCLVQLGAVDHGKQPEWAVSFSANSSKLRGGAALWTVNRQANTNQAATWWTERY